MPVVRDMTLSGTGEIARAQAVFNEFRPERRIEVRDTQTGAVYTNLPRARAVYVPFPGEYAVKATWKDRGGWHHFLPTTHLLGALVEIVSSVQDRVTFLVLDGKAVLSNAWTVDLELEPPIHETVSWWRW